ncbi:MAG: flagellar protein FliT [Proteobacteria bacterium]|nr:flagellar protein FliT [Pseudomonadota bacterium]
MSVNSEVVYCYERLAIITARMLELSRQEEWGELPALETLCSALVQRLKEIENDTELSSEQREVVRHSLINVRRDQEEVIRLVKPQLRQLLTGIASLQAQASLGKAYGGSH